MLQRRSKSGDSLTTIEAEPKKRNHFHRQQSTLTGQFFCPKNGETLSPSAGKLNFQQIFYFSG
jgi:hypothetical protein